MSGRLHRQHARCLVAGTIIGAIVPPLNRETRGLRGFAEGGRRYPDDQTFREPCLSLNITAVFQMNDGTRWVDVPSAWAQESDPALWEWLGAGGGMPGGFDIEPLASQRGAPDDFELVGGGTFHPVASLDIHAPSRRQMQALLREGHVGYLQVCMGSTDMRWLRVAEILAATAPRMVRTLAMPIRIFQTWDGRSLPARWDLMAADVAQRPPAAPGVYARPHEIAGNTRYVEIEWDFDFALEFSDFLDELRSLQARHGDVRMVYAFY